MEHYNTKSSNNGLNNFLLNEDILHLIVYVD